MSEKISLLSDSSDSEVDFKINKNYADRYDTWRNKEELQKLKDLSKDISESSSSEEEEAEPEIEEDFLKTLSLLKSKDPKIYDKNISFFKEHVAQKRPKEHKPKPMFMKDYERKLVLERNGEFSDEDEPLNKLPTYSEEQDEIKQSFKDALGNSDDEEDLLQARQKTEDENKAEEAEYLRWLKGQEEKVTEDTEKEMSFLRKYWNDPKLDDGEKFLKDFILNKRYVIKDNEGEIPTYDEITGDVEMLQEDEKILEQQETFEHKYNFRFEEPDDEFIKRYPRTIGDSLRKADSKRKQKREEYTERKKKEKDQKREELKRLKALKRKEIEEKFSKLKEICGQEEINLDENDIESDFDPDKHDQKMKELFNDDYYKVEEQDKPLFSYDEELDDENWNAWCRENVINNEENDADDEETKIIVKSEDNDHFDAKEEFEKEMIESTQSKKRKKKKSLFAKVISEPKPLYDPDGKSFDEYLDEYYKLDYEDIIGDLPVRYRYRKVVPNNFGLSVEEILAANDKELNRWCSLKKTCQYREEEEELYDVQAFQRKTQNEFAKKKIFQSIYLEKEEPTKNDEGPSAGVSTSKKKRKKKSKGKNKAEECGSVTGDSEMDNKLKPIEGNNLTEEHMLEIDSLTESAIEKQGEEGGDPSVQKEENLVTAEVRDLKPELGTSEIGNKKSRKRKRKKNNLLELSQVDEGVHFVASNHQQVDANLSNSIEEMAHKKPKLAETEESITEHNFSSIGETQPLDQASSSSSPKKRKKKKKKKKAKSDDCPASVNKNPNKLISKNMNNAGYSHPQQKSKFKQNLDDKRLQMSDARLSAYGLNPKKFKNHIIYSQK